MSALFGSNNSCKTGNKDLPFSSFPISNHIDLKSCSNMFVHSFGSFKGMTINDLGAEENE